MQADYNERENLKVPEKKEQNINFEQPTQRENKENIERTNLAEKSNIASQLRREIEMMELDDNLKEEAKKKAKKIEFLGEQEKIEHLLEIAKEKGILVAIQTAKETNDPNILDILHDLLSKDEYYKDFIK
jgi:hypothetical protein